MDIIVLKSFIPETFLSVTVLFQLVFNIQIIKYLKFNFPVFDKEVFSQTFFILLCLLFLFLNLKVEGFMSNCLFVNDAGSNIIKILSTLTCLTVLKIIFQAFSIQKINFFEFFIFFLLSFLSLVLLASAYDLISFYVTIEMQALCFYIMSSIKRDSAFSTESGLKYFLAGSFISLFFLFGASLLYGTLGTLNLNNISLLLYFPLANFDLELNFFVTIGIFFVTFTLLFKIACAPFHFWAPDVYEGAPLSSTIIFSIIPKLSIFLFFIKWLCSVSIFSSHIRDVLLLFGVLSVLIGTIFSLVQKRLKRLIIYSSIAQIGFLVSGLSLNTLGGFSSVYFFLIIYLITTILVWGHLSVFCFFQSCVNTFYSRLSSSLFLSSFSNLSKLNPLWSFSFILIFFSIGGIPPLSGFLSKVLILLELIKSFKTIFAICLIVISSISVFYYIRVIKVMFFEFKSIEFSEDTEKFQVIFFNPSLDTLYLIFVFNLFFLITIFFSPNLLILLCQYIVLTSIGF